MIYKDKTLDDFDVESDASIFKLFFELLLNMDGTRVTDENVENKITNLFNDACFICNAVVQMKRPYLHYGYFRDLVSYFDTNGNVRTLNPIRPDIVMCMVYFLLKEHGGHTADIEKFKSTIDSDLRERSRESKELYELFSNAYSNTETKFLSEEFIAKLPITPENLKQVCWSEISKNYNKQVLKDIVSFWSDPHERNLVIDDIEKEINNNMEDELPF